MSQLGELFSKPNKKLIGYVPAGYPNFEGAKQIIKSMVSGGVDAIEVGFPYSDPVMDGPTIQAASAIALENGATVATVLETLKFSSSLGVPAVVMTYWNPVEKFGIRKFAKAINENGGAGVITPDLTIDEASEWLTVCREFNIDPIFVVAPSTSDERLKRVANSCGGFVYAASLMGVTGARTVLSSTARELVARLRRHTSLPIAVGLGVSNADQARDVANFADGVIVGSAFISLVQNSSNEKEALEKVRVLASELAQAVRERG